MKQSVFDNPALAPFALCGIRVVFRNTATRLLHVFVFVFSTNTHLAVEGGGKDLQLLFVELLCPRTVRRAAPALCTHCALGVCYSP